MPVIFSGGTFGAIYFHGVGSRLIKSLLDFHHLVNILYIAFCQKKTFYNIGERHIIHFMGYNFLVVPKRYMFLYIVYVFCNLFILVLTCFRVLTLSKLSSHPFLQQVQYGYQNTETKNKYGNWKKKWINCRLCRTGQNNELIVCKNVFIN